MLNEPTIEKLRALRLDTMAATWEEQDRQRRAKHLFGAGAGELRSTIAAID